MRLKTGDDSVFLCRRIRKDNRGYERFIVNLEREEYVNSAMSHLNSVYSTEKNLLSSLFVFNRKENIIAELGARLNVIHLYSVSDDFCRTVSVKNKLDNVVEKEMCVQNEMTKTYYDAKAFDSFFLSDYIWDVQ